MPSLDALAERLARVEAVQAEEERWWDVRPETLARFRSLLASSPRVEIRRQIAAGHNVSLGWTARAYHLAAIAFGVLNILDASAGSPENFA